MIEVLVDINLMVTAEEALPYVSTEWLGRLSEQSSLKTGFHYEKNLFTSDRVGDRRRRGVEDVYQADLQWNYRIIQAWSTGVGSQRSQRQISLGSISSLTGTHSLGCSIGCHVEQYLT
ncbi:MAG: hypothetical protein M3Z35_09565 [Nitrospirota bacterium]|nr:hypothetical protein [Nitrospirota bacterium]